MYSLKTTPEASRPCLFSDLMTLDCDSILCSTWRPKSSATARHEIDQQEKFISFFKVGVLSRVMAGKDSASLDTGAGAKAANNAVDDLSEVIRALDKKAQGEFSLRLLIAARSLKLNSTPSLPPCIGSLSKLAPRSWRKRLGIFRRSTPCSLATGSSMSSRCGWAKTITPGCPPSTHRIWAIVHSEDLDAEYLNVFETRTRTPFFQDVYVGWRSRDAHSRSDGQRQVGERQPGHRP